MPIPAEFSVTVKGPNGIVVFQRFAVIDTSIDEKKCDESILEHACAIIDAAIKCRNAYRRNAT